MVSVNLVSGLDSRVFIAGEVAGQFGLLQSHLNDVGFDVSKDRLILSGNITGYCISSRALSSWLSLPWVTGIMGRSEAEILGKLCGNRKPTLAGQWLGMLGNTERSRIKGILSGLPLYVDINHGGKRVIVSYAGAPEGCDWDVFSSELTNRPESNNVLIDLFSDRYTDMRILGLAGKSAIDSNVGSVDAYISNLRIESPSPTPLRRGNRYFLDGSAHMNHGDRYDHRYVLPFCDLETLFDRSSEGICEKKHSVPSDSRKRIFSTNQRLNQEQCVG